MESEEFYDSLEESSEYDSVDPYPHTSSKNSENRISKMHTFCEYDIPDDVIPFYDKKLSRSEINVQKKDMSRQDTADNKKKWKSKKCTSYLNRNNKLQSKSYLDIFYAKSGIENSRDNIISTTNMIETSPKSFTTCDDFDVRSIYLKSEDNSGSSNGSGIQNCQENGNLFTYQYERDENIQGIYYNNLNIKQDKRIKYLKTSEVPELGKLGPDIKTDKLELLKRRQMYGKMVSRSNRIKMMERKAVRDLQNEIDDSKACL